MIECVHSTDFLTQHSFSPGKFQSREESGKKDQSPFSDMQAEAQAGRGDGPGFPGF